jgi:hypothetical protein
LIKINRTAFSQQAYDMGKKSNVKILQQGFHSEDSNYSVVKQKKLTSRFPEPIFHAIIAPSELPESR